MTDPTRPDPADDTGPSYSSRERSAGVRRNRLTSALSSAVAGLASLRGRRED